MIRVDSDTHGLTIFRWDNLQDGRRNYYTHDGKTKALEPGKPAPFWMVLGHHDAQALQNALNDYAETAIPEVAALQAELKATKLHLADMRSLVMLDPKQSP